MDMKLDLCVLLFTAIIVFSRQEALCPSGTYGSNCELQCPKDCGAFRTYPCEKSTGRCSEGCRSGLYGAHCNTSCSCPGACMQDTGICIGADTTTQSHINCNVKGASCVGWIVTMVLLILLCIGGSAFIVFKLKRRRCMECMTYLRRQESIEKETISEKVQFGKDTSPPTIEIQSPTPDAVSSLDEEHTETHVLIPAVVEGVTKQETEHLKEELRQKGKILEEKTAKIEQLNLDLQNTLEEKQRIISDNNNFLEKLGLRTNTHYEVLHSTKIDRSKFLECIKLNFDADKINRKHVSLSDEGRLVNTAKPEQDNENQAGFVHYMGTCSDIPISQTSTPQYFEVVADIKLNKPLGERDVLLEIAFCKTEARDVGQFTPRRENCYSFSIAYNVKKQEICVTTVAQKENNEIFSCLTNTTGCNITLEIGILIHDANKIKIIIFNLNDNKTITSFDNVQFLIELWPMFGLSARSLANISMGLISGSDIEMTEKKKALIDSVLNPPSWKHKLLFST